MRPKALLQNHDGDDDDDDDDDDGDDDGDDDDDDVYSASTIHAEATCSMCLKGGKTQSIKINKKYRKDK